MKMLHKQKESSNQIHLHLFLVKQCLERADELQIRGWGHIVMPLQFIVVFSRQITSSSVEILTHLYTSLLGIRFNL